MADCCRRAGRNAYDAGGHVTKVPEWLSIDNLEDAVGAIATTLPGRWVLRGRTSKV